MEIKHKEWLQSYTAQKLLRKVYTLGYGLNSLLVFVPAYTMKVGFWGEEKIFSDFTLIRYSFSEQLPALGCFGFVVVMFIFSFFVLSLVYQKRWVFVAGALYVLLFLAFDLFTPDPDNIRSFVVPSA